MGTLDANQVTAVHLAFNGGNSIVDSFYIVFENRRAIWEAMAFIGRFGRRELQ